MGSEEEPTEVQRIDRAPVDRSSVETPCVVVLTGRKVGCVVRVLPEGTLVGKNAECELVLDDEGVSRQHCLVFQELGVWRIRDLGSTNGTFLGEKPVTGEEALREGDRIRLGKEVILRFGTQDAIERQFLDRLYRSATRDALTGLANRRLFREQLDTEVAWHRRHGHALSVLFVDIDHFKLVNDTLGHPVGDQVLTSVAGVIAGEVRAEDLVARYGGEEFVVLLKQTPADRALAVAERVRAAVERHPFPAVRAAGLGPLTVSVGVATRAGDDLSGAEPLVADADAWLYQAKRRGRNRVASGGGS